MDKMSAQMPVDSFSIELLLRHPSRSLLRTTRDLSLKGWTTYKTRGKRRWPAARRKYFKAILRNGNSPSEFERAFTSIVKFVRKNEAFWKTFIDEEGHVELILNYAILPQSENGDKCFELFLTPAFCEQLRVQGWQGFLSTDRSAVLPARDQRRQRK